MTKSARAALVLAAALLMLASAASAHGPPAPRGQESYLIVDHNDDCEQDDRCPGHDLVALYVSESHDAGLGDLVNLRLITLSTLHGSGTTRDVVSLKANGQAKTFELTSSDQATFTGPGCDRVTRSVAYAPSGTADGSRIIVECSVKLATLGGVGAKLTDQKVDSFRGTTKGDYMPGGYWNDLGLQISNPDQGDGATNKVSPGYTLRGPGYYATVDLPDRATVRSDGEAVAEVQVTNALKSIDWDMAQTVTLSVAGADGFTATWVGGLGSDPTTIELDVKESGLDGASRTAELRLRGDGHAPTTGTLTLTLDTNLGGHSAHEVPYEILPADAATDDAGTHGGDSKGSPAPVAALLALALLALAAARRQA